jgi:hypothetical protein
LKKEYSTLVANNITILSYGSVYYSPLVFKLDEKDYHLTFEILTSSGKDLMSVLKLHLEKSFVNSILNVNVMHIDVERNEKYNCASQNNLLSPDKTDSFGKPITSNDESQLNGDDDNNKATGGGGMSLWITILGYALFGFMFIFAIYFCISRKYTCVNRRKMEIRQQQQQGGVIQDGIALPIFRNAIVVPNNTVVGNVVVINDQRQNANLTNRNNNSRMNIGMSNGLPQMIDAPKVNTVGATAINDNFMRHNPVPPPINNIRNATNTSSSSSSSHK